MGQRLTGTHNIGLQQPPRRDFRMAEAVLGGLAEFERDLIRARTAEGRLRAKARGVKLAASESYRPISSRTATARRR